MDIATLSGHLAFGLIAFSFLVLVLQAEVNAQIVIGTPNLGFSQACAS